MAVHRIDPRLLAGPVSVVVVGCGGTGCALAGQLPMLHQTLLAWGHPGGLHVTLLDDDVVSETNCLRMAFSRADVGRPKAHVLVERMNYFYGLAWRAEARALRMKDFLRAHIVIGCVDTRAARAVIARVAAYSRVAYWLDCGNNDWDGQFVLGQPGSSLDWWMDERHEPAPARLPTVAELFPETVDGSRDDDTPACSAVEALARQGPGVNPAVASHAYSLLARLFRYGQLAHHGEMINLATGVSSPIPVWPHCAMKDLADERPIRCELLAGPGEPPRLRCAPGSPIAVGDVVHVSTDSRNTVSYRTDAVHPARLGVRHDLVRLTAIEAGSADRVKVPTRRRRPNGAVIP